MSNQILLLREMVDQCRQLVRRLPGADSNMPLPFRQEHLFWMCDQLNEHTESWPETRLHRWIGFIQAALLANDVLDLDGLKNMFDKAKVAYGKMGEDLFDHLNPDSTFEFDMWARLMHKRLVGVTTSTWFYQRSFNLENRYGRQGK